MGQERRDDGGQVSLVAMGPCGTRFEFRIISWSYILNIVTEVGNFLNLRNDYFCSYT